MNKYLPSKQFIKIIGITILVGAILFFVGNVVSNKSFFQKQDKTSANVSAEQKGDFFDIDSDNDGLFDWEEALWGTNPRLKDSDNDGVDDKKYVENKRDEIDSDETYTPDDSNETDLFARQFFATASVLNQSGSFDQEAVDQFSKSIGQSINNFNIQDKYKLSDLKMSAVAPDVYYKNLSTVFSELISKNISELSVIARIIENPEDQSAVNDLSAILAVYKNMENSLLKTETPYSISGTHLSLLNSVYKVSEILNESRNISKDPLRVTVYLSKYNEFSENISNDFETLTSYFRQNGIIN
jgi:hypothetical protein